MAGVGGAARRVVQRIWAWRTTDRWVLVAWGLVVLPILTAAANSIRHDWRPIGDNAFVEIRANDVLTSHHPWLGTWSSASVSAGSQINHPGPLLFDSLAPTVKLFGGSAGLAIGVALVNILAVTTISVFSFRRGGRSTALAALAATAMIVYTMGSELLFDPWNPHILMLICLAMLVTAWGIASGDRWAWPVYVALASYSLQTHLGYAYFVPGVLAVALATGALIARACPGGPRWLPTRRTLVMSVVTGVVLWAQPVWEQLTGAGEGNMTRLLGAGGTGPKIGGELAVRLFSDIFIGAPVTPRDDFMGAVPGFVIMQSGALKPLDAPSVGWASAILLVLLAAIVVLGRAAVRRHDRLSLAVLGISTGAMLVALASLTIMPIGPLGLAAHQMRWLWPITWFTWMALAIAMVRWIAHSVRVRPPAQGALQGVLQAWPPRRLAAVAAMGGVAVVSLLAVPSFRHPAGPAARADQIPLIHELSGQMGGLEGRGVVYVDTTGEPFLDNVSSAVMAALQRRDIDFVVGPEWLVRQLGDERRFSGNESLSIVLPRDDAALLVPEGGRREALVTPLSVEEQAELVGLRELQAAGEQLTAPEQQRLDALLIAAIGSVAVISYPGGPGEFVPLPEG